MAQTGKIKGFDKVLRNLNKEINQIEGRSMKGLILAGIHIRRETETVPPVIPVDTGNLRASWVTSSFKVPAGISHNIGYNANYAAFVHEMVDAQFFGRKPVKRRKGKKSMFPGGRPDSGAKWFQAALGRNHKKILAIIRENAKIKR